MNNDAANILGLVETENIVLSERDWEKFVEALESPAPDESDLSESAVQYRGRMATIRELMNKPAPWENQ